MVQTNSDSNNMTAGTNPGAGVVIDPTVKEHPCVSSKTLLCKNVFCKRLIGIDARGDCKSSQSVLFVTTFSFFFFTVALWFGATLSNSLSLTADAIAMSVDVVTYFVNMFAETMQLDSKGGGGGGEGELSAYTRFKLEVVVPTISCLALLASGSWIAWSAYEVLVPPEGAPADAEEPEVNIATLYAFSSVNFCVDILSVWMFYRKGKSAFEYDQPAVDEEAAAAAAHAGAAEGGEEGEGGGAAIADVPADTDPEAKPKNVNMMSAFLHVGADSIRTFAVFSAAAVATSGQDGAKCDAWAAEVCTLTVLFMIIPVVKEIRKSAKLLLPIMRQEREHEREHERSAHLQKGGGAAVIAGAQVPLVATSA